ncbi:hypothetical protein SAICODRAFT_32100 [Saitoella complicata NRRL Y-17804]|uniref:uncharacterized protein n=1 Tax=Saitoella complicata (strain BCRC 22490 / CBS 7301 / JCM 7358 / NBRC 10748 / NRRL Y-17804) TaxID=698492 RepID=UPI00086766BC|nr:uncharacterized protein SAICODRAFT_32100 [Saitoella complicata NRRL Y-17804]ODQ50139.1 hypothetical protein SAICODRAFT_32100 [Saitoella complicata NRRL Y-17804]
MTSVDYNHQRRSTLHLPSLSLSSSSSSSSPAPSPHNSPSTLNPDINYYPTSSSYNHNMVARGYRNSSSAASSKFLPSPISPTFGGHISPLSPTGTFGVKEACYLGRGSQASTMYTGTSLSHSLVEITEDSVSPRSQKISQRVSLGAVAGSGPNVVPVGAGIGRVGMLRQRRESKFSDYDTEEERSVRHSYVTTTSTDDTDNELDAGCLDAEDAEDLEDVGWDAQALLQCLRRQSLQIRQLQKEMRVLERRVASVDLSSSTAAAAGALSTRDASFGSGHLCMSAYSHGGSMSVEVDSPVVRERRPTLPPSPPQSAHDLKLRQLPLSQGNFLTMDSEVEDVEEEQEPVIPPPPLPPHRASIANGLMLPPARSGSISIAFPVPQRGSIAIPSVSRDRMSSVALGRERMGSVVSRAMSIVSAVRAASEYQGSEYEYSVSPGTDVAGIGAWFEREEVREEEQEEEREFNRDGWWESQVKGAYWDGESVSPRSSFGC